MNGESANKFITALVKSLQTLCHGYVEFHDGIEIIGHLYLNIDSGSTFDYVLKEKVCKNAENSTVFVSKSFHAQAQAEDILIRKEKDTDLSPGNDHEPGLEGSGMSPTGTTRLQSAITNISNVLAGSENQKGRLEHLSHSPSPHNTGKRKREHNGNYSNLQPPYKYTTLQSTSSAMPYFNNSSKQSSAASRDHSDFNNASQSNEFFGADSNQSSGMGPDDEEDLDLDVTFVKEEYGDRGQRGGQAAASRVSQDPSSSQSSLLHDNSPSGNYPMGYPPPQSQQFTGPGDVGSLGQSFHDGSQLDVGQQNVQAVPNPRSNSSGKSHTFQVPAVPTKYFRCHVCGIIIRHKNNIKRHMRKHNASHGLRDNLSSPVSPIDTTFGLGSLPQAAVTKKNDLIHTIRQNKWAVTRAREWLTNQGMPTNFEQFSEEDLNQMLLGFYTSGQKKDGSPFSGTALLAFRTALNRYLNQKYGRQISLATTQAFKPSNAVLSRILATTVKVNRAMPVLDIKLLYTSGTLSNCSPENLLYKVWFELQMHFRSKVLWSKIQPEDFYFYSGNGKVGVTWNTCGMGNCHQMTTIESNGGPYCAVASLKLYLGKRNVGSRAFLQVPASKELFNKGIWFIQEEYRSYKEKGIMKRMSSMAKLSQSYSNAFVSSSYEEFFQAMVSLNRGLGNSSHQ